MKKCCEKNSGGNFCPVCGSPLRPARAATLLVYLKRQRDTLASRCKGLREYFARTGDEPSESEQKRIAKFDSQLAKWNAWVDLVDTLTAPAPSAQPPTASP